MRKALFTTSIIAFTAMSISSCSDCDLCTKDSAPEMRICESDYDNSTQYGLALDALEIQGYDCR
jgi:hypothetical protein